VYLFPLLIGVSLVGDERVKLKGGQFLGDQSAQLGEGSLFRPPATDEGKESVPATCPIIYT
jgi:hypothetical protein